MIGRNGMSQSRQVRVRALGSSAMTVALLLAGPAFAQCAPDPTVAGGTTICSGTDVDGLSVNTAGTTVIVETGAVVNGAGGNPAIDIDNWGRLTNAGTIVGNVVIGSTGATAGTTVDSTAGRITGSLRFGSAADTLVALFDGTRLRYGVNGAIDGGVGNDTVRVRLTADTMIATSLRLPTAFERLSLVPNAGTTTTLTPDFATNGVLLIGGNGTLINTGDLFAAAQVIGSDNAVDGLINFRNAGSVISDASTGSTSAISLSRFARFENLGKITGGRNGVNLSGTGQVINSGNITVSQTALSVVSENFTNTETGELYSNDGIALSVSGVTGTGRLNAGLIGGVTGARIASSLANTGTITGTQTGVLLNGNGVLDNRAGGVILGPAAISAAAGNLFTTDNTVLNAGTIMGNVVLGNSTDTVFRNNNRYFALPGGVLNGDLTLGRNDLLITDLVNTGPGAFAGITGQVNASSAQLRLRVGADASAAMTAPAGFRSIGYELQNGVNLTLTGTTDQTMLLAGRGNVRHDRRDQRGRPPRHPDHQQDARPRRTCPGERADHHQ